MCYTDDRKIQITEIERCAFHDGPGLRTVAFFAGCPLFCRWCCNPEAQSPQRLFLRDPDKCLGCLHCVRDCPGGALSWKDGKILHSPARCRECGLCRENCPSGAIEFSACRMTVSEILSLALRDRAYYQRSGGGLTLSGGEPFFQPEGALSLLRAAKGAGLHTVVETTACVDGQILREAKAWVDLFYIDLKHADEQKLLEWTGAKRPAYEKNVRLLRSLGARFVLRTPVIPGFNNTPQEMEAIFRLAAELQPEAVALLPYHALGKCKYRKLARAYPMGEAAPPEKSEMLAYREIARGLGLKAQIL